MNDENYTGLEILSSYWAIEQLLISGVMISPTLNLTLDFHGHG